MTEPRAERRLAAILAADRGFSPARQIGRDHHQRAGVDLDRGSSPIFWLRTNTFESFRLEKPTQMEGSTMKIATIRRWLAKDRPMVSVTRRIPEDVIAAMRRIAPMTDVSGYQTPVLAPVCAKTLSVSRGRLSAS